MIFRRWRAMAKKYWCKKCACYQRATHRHWILDKDDPQFEVGK